MKIIKTSHIVLLYAALVSITGCAVNTISKEIPSPDKQFKAVVFERNAGATSGFSTQISIIRNNESLPDDGGNVFIADTDHGAAPSGEYGGPAVKVFWQGNRKLLLNYHPKARVFKSETQLSIKTGFFSSEKFSVKFKTSNDL